MFLPINSVIENFKAQQETTRENIYMDIGHLCFNVAFAFFYGYSENVIKIAAEFKVLIFITQI